MTPTEPDPQKAAWFEYSITSGRFSAVPVSLMGWLVLFGAILAPLAVVALVAPFADRLPGIVLLPLLLALIAASVMGAMKIAIAKGRRRR